MATYRFYNPAPVFMGLLGEEKVPGGSLTFYDLGTTDPRDTYADPDMGVTNANPVTLDSAGRVNGNVFLDGDYTVVLKNSDGESIWTRDLTPGGDGNLSIPPPTAGYFLTSPDGVNLAWAQVIQMPDPTGSTGQVPTTNGSGYDLLDLPDFTPPDPEIVVDANSFQAGVSTDETKYFVLRGTGTAPATGQLTSTASLTFSPSFDALWHVSVTPTVAGVTANSPPGIPVAAVTGWTPGSASSGASVTFYMAPVQTISSEDTITTPVTFSWIAIGTREVAP